ncbi:MAG: tetratricopeptide repeat protein [Deltaproteobacteria bacterium]|nr:tetratricopeptide repeat protein [Deltaproteobacteria bacterium]
MRSRLLLLLPLGGLLLLGGCAGKQKPEEAPLPEVTDTGAEASTPEIPTDAVARAPEPEVRRESESSSEMPPPRERPEPEVEEKEAAPEPPPPPPKKKRTSRGQSAFDAGVRANAKGDLTTAEGHFLEAVTKDDQLEWGWYNLGAIREHKGDVSGARTAYRQALQVKADFTEASANLTALLVRQDKIEEAERDLRRRIARYPAELEFRNLLAGILVVRGGQKNLDAAFTEARKVLKADERNVGAMIVLGQVFYEQGKLELAGSVLENAVQIDPSHAQAHNLRGFVFLAQKERDKAFQAFKRAAELRPDFPEAHINYGAFLNQAQSFDEAVQELELAVKYAPKRPDAHLNLGNAYRGAGEHQKALAEYKRVQELDPRSADALFNLGLLYLDAPLEGIEILPRLKKAREYFERYQAAGGKDERISLFIGDADKAINKEERRIERERKAALRKAQEEAEAKERAAERASSSRLGEEEEEDPGPGTGGSTLGAGDEEEK